MRTGDRKWRDLVYKGALELGIELDDKKLAALSFHAENLVRWNKKINLTAIRDPLDIAEKHILDSIFLSSLLKEGKRLLDMGSGAGFPGLSIAIMQPDLEVLMLDSVKKKVSFINEVIQTLSLKNAKALHLRVQDLKKEDSFDLIVSRAFTSLENFLFLARPLLSEKARIFAMKSLDIDEELKKSLELFSDMDIKKHSYNLPFSKQKRQVLEISFF